jgi:hypothetical protein
VRLVSLTFKDYIERLFATTYLPVSTISLALPRRDPVTGALKWPGALIPRARIVFTFDSLTLEKKRYVRFMSPETLGSTENVDELRRAGTLTEERLRAAPPWVHVGRDVKAGLRVDVPPRFGWDDGRKIWVWEVDWRKLVTGFYRAKREMKDKRGLTAVGRRGRYKGGSDGSW